MWALIVDGAVKEITPIDPAGRFADDMVWVAVPTGVAVGERWGYSGGSFTAPTAAPPATLAQQSSAAIYAAVVLASTGNPGLAGTYSIDADSQGDAADEVLAFDTNGTFLDGTTTMQWPDGAGALHAFSPSEFKAFVTAIGAYVGLLKSIRRTNALPAGMTAMPVNSLTIA